MPLAVGLCDHDISAHSFKYIDLRYETDPNIVIRNIYLEMLKLLKIFHICLIIFPEHNLNDFYCISSLSAAFLVVRALAIEQFESSFRHGCL